MRVLRGIQPLPQHVWHHRITASISYSSACGYIWIHTKEKCVNTFVYHFFYSLPWETRRSKMVLHVFVPEESSLKRKWWRGIYLRKKHTLTVKKRAASAVSTNRGLLCVHRLPLMLYMYWHEIRKIVFLTVRLTVSHAPLTAGTMWLLRENIIFFLRRCLTWVAQQLLGVYKVASIKISLRRQWRSLKAGRKLDFWLLIRIFRRPVIWMEWKRIFE